MWSSSRYLATRTAVPLVAVVAASSTAMNVNFADCDAAAAAAADADAAPAPPPPPPPPHQVHNKPQRHATLMAAISNNNNNSDNNKRRFSTHTELAKLRRQQTALLQQWERDEEDGWRELPARAWPAFQPTPEQYSKIENHYQEEGCSSAYNANSQVCQLLAFQMATTLVFYQVDAVKGLQQFERLARQGHHVDSMVACGIILMEGIGGVQPNEKEGLRWLRQAADQHGSAQACYELGACYYTGIDGLVEEDAEQAFRYFQRAADKGDHTAALYMMADCLVEGDGVEKSLARAIPLFSRAADRGHRYARQRIRELLKNEK